MRILHFLPVYAPAWQFGGPVLSVSRLCEGLVRERVDVRVITTNAGLPDFPHSQLGLPQKIKGVEVIYYPVNHHSGVIRSEKLLEALPDHMDWADLVHLSSIWQPLGIPVQEAAAAAAVPVIQTPRGALGPYSWKRHWWKKIPYFVFRERALLQRAAALHCTTSQEARELSWLGLRPPIHLLPNPLDVSQLSYDPALGRQWRQQNRIPSSQPLLLVAGRMHHKKGLDLLPRVLKKVAHLPWQIVFVGPDDDGTGLRLRNTLDIMGLKERCHWFDSIPAEQLSGPYNAADCLLLPSHHENFGNVVVEALLCGCGVLISQNVGVAGNLLSCPGVSVIPRDTTLWSSHLLKVLNTNRPGASSCDWVSAKFSSQSVAREAAKLYSYLLNLS